MSKLILAVFQRISPAVVAVAFLLTSFILGIAQIPITNDPPVYGPYNGIFLAGGDGLRKPMVERDTVLLADSPWTLYAWVQPQEALTAPTLLAGLGTLDDEYPRMLGYDNGKLVLWMGADNSFGAPAQLTPGKFHFLAASFDGATFRLFSDGSEVGTGKLTLGRVSPLLQIALPVPLHTPTGQPGEVVPPWPNLQHFGGKIALLTLMRRTLSAEEIRQLSQRPPDFAVVEYEEGSKPWPVQTRGQAGYRAPQDPTTWPTSKAPFSKPVVHPLPKSDAALHDDGNSQWTLAGGWELKTAPSVDADGAAISQSSFEARDWWKATVPGTVLTTMIDRGVYPDPDYVLNNLAIPESLNKQDYWYRNQFTAPKDIKGKQLTLTFQGINYKANVWLNGRSLGTIKGAFIRGVFDVTDDLKFGQTNVLAVRVSPPPHPGIPHEQSVRGGPGENGGLMCLDGPTFVATEGWDWIPAIRDRDTGIWQPVTLTASGMVKIGDPQVVTSLPLPDMSRANVEINVPLENTSNAPITGTLTASFEQVSVTRQVTAPPGKSEMKLAASEFPQLTVQNPRLWWPNGYGKQELYRLKLVFAESGGEADTKQVRFGIREVTYELSLLDRSGHLRRVEVSPTIARSRNEQVIDVSHDGMRQIPFADTAPIPEWMKDPHSWVASLVPGAESSPAVLAVDDTKAAPYLIIKVNGVRIAARGGNWGMDDARKRVSRERLEPYFRLHHDANLNIIRNWVGQNTEEAFYDLADEYGLMVWNDFWASTQDYNIEPQDPQLFLENARDTILRFRNHPSIVMWCGRNEGVPQPILNQGLAKLINTLDGTRYYSPSSNQVNLQNSGPYKYQDPALYFTTLNHGFSVETGTPSFSTLESFRAWIPAADQWPVSDDWAYHDWHQSGNGDMAPFTAEVEAEFGAGTSLEDFERKAQMLNFVDHRAIFEGMNAHLWAPNSGRMLWMTQPAWPSNTWQILSSDYDTQASFYGVKKACEPVHVQMDPSDYSVAILNTTTAPLTGLTLTADVFSLDNKSLLHHEERKDAAADAVSDGFKLDLAPLIRSNVVLVKLELKNGAGQLLSDNLYWQGAKSSAYRALTHLPAATVTASAASERAGHTVRVNVHLQNGGTTAALANKLTLFSADGTRILPVYYTDNYVSLLPGEARDVQAEYPASAATGAPVIQLRGWNLPSTTLSASQK
jgi:beta-galactosidase/beta-glucuronidase